jgi:putative flippase GtrA
MPSKKPTTQPKTSLVRQGAKFGIVGIANTIIDYTIYITVTKVLNVPLSRVFLVKYFSGSVAMINSFYWNRRWVFPGRIGVGKAGARFLVATLVSVYLIQPGMVDLFSATTMGQHFGTFWFDTAKSLGLVSLVPHILTRAFTIKTAAFAMGALSAAIWNFILYRLWAFKND